MAMLIHLNERGDFLNGESGVRGDLVAVVISSCLQVSQHLWVLSSFETKKKEGGGRGGDIPYGCTSPQTDRTTCCHRSPSPSA